MPEKSLIELIEEIINYSSEYHETKSDPILLLIKDRASVLAERLDVSNTSAICFAYILKEAAWGNMPKRSEVMRFLPPNTNTNERLSSLWELLDAQLIRSYQPHRNPIRHYFLDQEVAEMILANKVPSTKNTNTLFPNESERIQLVSKGSESNDYLIMLDETPIGYVFHKPSGIGFDVYHKGNFLFESESLADIKEKLNDFIEQKKL